MDIDLKTEGKLIVENLNSVLVLCHTPLATLRRLPHADALHTCRGNKQGDRY